MSCASLAAALLFAASAHAAETAPDAVAGLTTTKGLNHADLRDLPKPPPHAGLWFTEQTTRYTEEIRNSSALLLTMTRIGEDPTPLRLRFALSTDRRRVSPDDRVTVTYTADEHQALAGYLEQVEDAKLLELVVDVYRMTVGTFCEKPPSIESFLPDDLRGRLIVWRVLYDDLGSHYQYFFYDDRPAERNSRLRAEVLPLADDLVSQFYLGAARCQIGAALQDKTVEQLVASLPEGLRGLASEGMWTAMIGGTLRGDKVEDIARDALFAGAEDSLGGWVRILEPLFEPTKEEPTLRELVAEYDADVEDLTRISEAAAYNDEVYRSASTGTGAYAAEFLPATLASRKTSSKPTPYAVQFMAGDAHQWDLDLDAGLIVGLSDPRSELSYLAGLGANRGLPLEGRLPGTSVLWRPFAGVRADGTLLANYAFLRGSVALGARLAFPGGRALDLGVSQLIAQKASGRNQPNPDVSNGRVFLTGLAVDDPASRALFLQVGRHPYARTDDRGQVYYSGNAPKLAGKADIGLNLRVYRGNPFIPQEGFDANVAAGGAAMGSVDGRPTVLVGLKFLP